MIGRLHLLIAAAVTLGVFVAPPASAVTLPDIEDEVMCPTCKMPLDRSQSPQANAQRRFIRGLIADGKDKDEVKAALVAEYGQAVLADPDGDGFGIAAYVVPLILLGGLGVGLALMLPRTRQRPKANGASDGQSSAAPEPSAILNDSDQARLDADLARYDAG